MKPSAICSPDEFEAAYVRPKFGRTLVVGSKVYATRVDRRLRYSVAVGIDMEPGPGVDVVLNLEETLPYTLGRFAHIDCISVLEHSRRPWLLAANVERLLEPGGTLYLSVPWVWRLHFYPGDYWRISVEGIRALFPAVKWSVLRYVNAGGEDSVPNIKQDGGLYFCKTQVEGFGCAS